MVLLIIAVMLIVALFCLILKQHSIEAKLDDIYNAVIDSVQVAPEIKKPN